MDHRGRVIGLLHSNLFNQLSSLKVHYQSVEGPGFILLPKTGIGKIVVPLLYLEVMGCSFEICHFYVHLIWNRQDIIYLTLPSCMRKIILDDVVEVHPSLT